MSNNLYLKFHVGPVQEFIAAARRTQDLWMGSWLLSHLSRTVFQFALDRGATTVLPHRLIPRAEPTDADTPNHFLLLVDAADGKTLAEELQKEVSAEWQRIAEKVRVTFFSDVDAELWNPQINSLLEIYWTLTPDDDSSKARAEAQAALDARKRLRDFQWTEQLHLKCTLCGLRQEISNQPYLKEARDWWIAKVKSCHGRLRVYEDGSERLCAVCVVKRAALNAGAFKPDLTKNDGHFPSTSGVAAAPFKAKIVEQLNVSKAADELQNFFDALHALHLRGNVDDDCITGLKDRADLTQPLQQELLKFDGDVFYPELFTENKFQKEFPGESEQLATATNPTRAVWLENAVTALKTLAKKVEAKPSKYFAVLMMDGDHMGAFFNQASQSEAEALSEAMSNFASQQAKQIVNEHLGRIVYAGGDDVMALLPLETVLPCAEKLQQEFKKAVKTITVTSTNVSLPTPSAGIAIAHHTAPLDLILRAVHQAESTAKNHYGRDALCVHVLKRSGEEVRIGTHWQAQLPLLADAIALFSEKILSMKFAYAVSESSRVLNSLAKDLCESELKRLTKRQCGDKYDKDNSTHQDRITDLSIKLAEWAEMEIGSAPDTRKLGLKEVADWLLLARFIAGGGQDND